MKRHPLLLQRFGKVQHPPDIRVYVAPFLICAALSLFGCATTEPGWTGSGATPFGRAEEACRAEASYGLATEDQQREQLFVGCMARYGWTQDIG